VERAAAHLPVPRADAARSVLVRRLLAQRTGERRPPAASRRRPSVALLLGSWIMDPHASPRRRVGAGLVAGVAAALLLFVTGWLVWYTDHRPPTGVARAAGNSADDSLVAELKRLNVTPTEGNNPRERVKAMADAADKVYARAKLRRNDAADLVALANLYGRVVDEGIVKHAEELSSEERCKVLKPIADRLKEADSEWQRLLQQTDLADNTKEALLKASLSARQGMDRLRELCAAS
jgi:hypothetical protein